MRPSTLAWPPGDQGRSGRGRACRRLRREAARLPPRLRRSLDRGSCFVLSVVSGRSGHDPCADVDTRTNRDQRHIIPELRGFDTQRLHSVDWLHMYCVSRENIEYAMGGLIPLPNHHITSSSSARAAAVRAGIKLGHTRAGPHACKSAATPTHASATPFHTDTPSPERTCDSDAAQPWQKAGTGAVG